MPDHEELLKKTYDLALHNNQMLRSMKRAAFWGTIFKIVLYAALLGIPVYLYLTIFQPILGDLLGTYSQIQETTSQAQQASLRLQGGLNPEELKALLENIPGVDFFGNQ
ncbi:hypothetical protein CL652_00135 [bacterium]|nr:hypothetical protein [bacterium]|tara:strand:- start:2710 stop:3036 length:327 start_codon:yes stop_codon:yes gene_type:complete